MSDDPIPGRRPPKTIEVPADSPAKTKVPGATDVLMPFDPHSEEAEAVRGALSFLFTLISLYGELVEASPVRDEDAGDCECKLN
ncbi:MAG: hypothetical protein ACLP7P_12530 [Rhodomicrobium sp.]